MPSDLQHAVEKLTARVALALPHRVQRALAGKPVVRDGAELDVETQLLLRLDALTRKKGAEELPIPQGRKVLVEQSDLVGGSQPIGRVEDLQVGGVPVRRYLPTSLADPAPESGHPTLVFFHGGGFIYGGRHATHDAACRFLAEQSGVQVLSVDYRLAPETPFPAAYDDCLEVFRAVHADPQALHVDPDRLAVGGDSAGGNLAAGVALAAAQDGLPVVFQLLIYPVTDLVNRSASRDAFGEGFFLTERFMDLATESYLPDPVQRSDPRASVIRADVPAGLAPVHLVTAGFDPLRDEGEAYARKLEEAGVSVELRREPGLIHGFFNWVGVGSTARSAVVRMAGRLRAALAG